VEFIEKQSKTLLSSGSVACGAAVLF